MKLAQAVILGVAYLSVAGPVFLALANHQDTIEVWRGNSGPMTKWGTVSPGMSAGDKPTLVLAIGVGLVGLFLVYGLVRLVREMLAARHAALETELIDRVPQASRKPSKGKHHRRRGG